MNVEREMLPTAAYAEVVGAERVRPATPADAIDGVQPQLVVTPGNADEAAHLLRIAHSNGLRVTPRGGGAKLGWGNPPHDFDLILSTERLNRVLEHAWGDMTATVEAGCTLARFQQALAQHNQRLALDPLWPEQATIGGILATNDSGSLRLRFGSLRDLLIGITIALPDGTLAKSGGKVVKNVAGYDLPKLMTGSLGTLGVIVEATFRLHPLPRATQSLSFAVPNVAQANQFLLKILDSSLAATGVQLRVDAAARVIVDTRFEGMPAAIDAQIRQVTRLAEPLAPTPASPEVWRAAEALWSGADPALVCKVSVLPSQLGAFWQAVEQVAAALRLAPAMVAQALGVGLLRLEGANKEVLLVALDRLRSAATGLGGSLVALHCPASIKARCDVWGAGGDTLPLMRLVKKQFDPQGTLTSGRFLGGI
ncbi:MAG: FAD-binding oxidoreductase [Chloroflexales bacterium]|nr:FAD-binding oxidoreductase [Chloroflexales bacterium]